MHQAIKVPFSRDRTLDRRTTTGDHPVKIVLKLKAGKRGDIYLKEAMIQCFVRNTEDHWTIYVKKAILMTTITGVLEILTNSGAITLCQRNCVVALGIGVSNVRVTFFHTHLLGYGSCIIVSSCYQKSMKGLIQ